MAIVLECHPASAMSRAFANYPVQDLKVVEVDLKTESVILESADGETAVLNMGDFVGLEDLEIIAINESVINLEGPPDDAGWKQKDCIPVVPIALEDDLNFIQFIPHAMDTPSTFH